MSYISREAAIDLIEEPIELLDKALDDFEIVGADRTKFEFTRDALNELKKDISEIPAADVVEVIRCVDCSHFVAYEEDDYWCKWWGESPDTTYGYCHSAERREP